MNTTFPFRAPQPALVQPPVTAMTAITDRVAGVTFMTAMTAIADRLAGVTTVTAMTAIACPSLAFPLYTLLTPYALHPLLHPESPSVIWEPTP